MKNLLIFDFDATLCSEETLEYAVKLMYPDNYEEKYNKMHAISTKAMNGEMLYRDNLLQKLNIIKPSKRILEETGELMLEHAVSQDKHELIGLLKKRDDCHIIIASGGVYDIIKATATVMDVPLYCVNLQYNAHGEYCGVEENGFSEDKWIGLKKHIKIQEYDNVIMIGDGNNDYRVFLNGVANHFIAYCEYCEAPFTKNITNPKVYNVTELYTVLCNLLGR
jgi:HAD superfamily phosphoserine phosphatase-like hydrolase